MQYRSNEHLTASVFRKNNTRNVLLDCDSKNDQINNFLVLLKYANSCNKTFIKRSRLFLPFIKDSI